MRSKKRKNSPRRRSPSLFRCWRKRVERRRKSRGGKKDRKERKKRGRKRKKNWRETGKGGEAERKGGRGTAEGEDLKMDRHFPHMALALEAEEAEGNGTEETRQRERERKPEKKSLKKEKEKKQSELAGGRLETKGQTGERCGYDERLYKLLHADLGPLALLLASSQSELSLLLLLTQGLGLLLLLRPPNSAPLRELSILTFAVFSKRISFLCIDIPSAGAPDPEDLKQENPEEPNKARSAVEFLSFLRAPPPQLTKDEAICPSLLPSADTSSSSFLQIKRKKRETQRESEKKKDDGGKTFLNPRRFFLQQEKKQQT